MSEVRYPAGGRFFYLPLCLGRRSGPSSSPSGKWMWPLTWVYTKVTEVCPTVDSGRGFPLSAYCSVPALDPPCPCNKLKALIARKCYLLIITTNIRCECDGWKSGGEGRYNDSLGLEGPGLETRWRRDFSDPSRGQPTLLYSGYWISFPGVKRSRRGANHTPACSSEVEYRYSYISPSLLCLPGT